ARVEIIAEIRTHRLVHEENVGEGASRLNHELNRSDDLVSVRARERVTLGRVPRAIDQVGTTATLRRRPLDEGFGCFAEGRLSVDDVFGCDGRPVIVLADAYRALRVPPGLDRRNVFGSTLLVAEKRWLAADFRLAKDEACGVRVRGFVDEHKELWQKVVVE